jgi:hypothetical protein
MKLSKTIRVSDAVHKRLEQIQAALKDQKGEHHAIISIMEKVVLNAPVDRLYAISLGDDLLDEVSEPDPN